jgi:putative ABC transport system ATP-binding protein
MTILSAIANDRSRGVLVVTHDARLLPFADRVIHLEDGRIVREEGKRAS